MSNNNQITAGGMAQLSGLEIFASNTVYGDETVGFGNPLFSSNIDSATDVGTEEAKLKETLRKPGRKMLN